MKIKCPKCTQKLKVSLLNVVPHSKTKCTCGYYVYRKDIKAADLENQTEEIKCIK